MKLATFLVAAMMVFVVQAKKRKLHMTAPVMHEGQSSLARNTEWRLDSFDSGMPETERQSRDRGLREAGWRRRRPVGNGAIGGVENDEVYMDLIRKSSMLVPVEEGVFISEAEEVYIWKKQSRRSSADCV